MAERVTEEKRRHHLHESVLQRAFREARLNVGLSKPETYNMLPIPSSVEPRWLVSQIPPCRYIDAILTKDIG
jgi:hypothetical protein